jgi:flagellar hook-associated protein 2
MEAKFRAGGLMSGMDTNSIIDQLVSIETQPLNKLRQRQTGLRSQVSQLADIASKVSGLSIAAQKLSTSGVLAAKTVSTNTSFSATTDSNAIGGRYSVDVETLATSAKFLSQTGYASGSAAVRGGTLNLNVKGKAYDPITIADGASLSDVALQINQAVSEVSAAVVFDGSSYYLSITNRETGFKVGQPPESALSVSMNVTGTAGQPLAMQSKVTATNAKLVVDTLSIEQESNEISGVIPGTTLSLKAPGAAEDLVLSTDSTATATNLQTFITAYNDVYKLVQQNLAITQDSSRNGTLAGDSTLRKLQNDMQRLLTKQVTGLSGVSSLADIGIKTERDGTLSLNTSRLQSAMAANPLNVNLIFSTATEGIGAAAKALSNTYTNGIDGLLVSRQNGLKNNIKSMDTQLASMQLRIDGYKDKLISQFTAMEKVMAQFKSIGTFLTQQSQQVRE